MVDVYVVLVLFGRRRMADVPAGLQESVRGQAEDKIGSFVSGKLLTQELYDKLFEAK